MTTTKPLTSAAILAQTASRNAIRTRDAIDDCFSPDWKAADAEARILSKKTTAAFEAAYRGGELVRPYWA